jgi:UDP-2,4-diacetamido-2,4,6-trideoxy-beta-L-altropyranose hydrolase
MKAVLRVDASRCVGMGHLVRTHALGRVLLERGVSTLFVTASEDSARWLHSRGEAMARIEVEPGGADDANAVARFAREQGAGWVVTDGNVFREDYLAALTQTGVPIASIDDLAAWYFPSGLVVNGGLGARRLRYRTATDTRVLLGPEYLLLREPFRRTAHEIRPAVERVFVSFGGSDPEDHTGLVLEAWSACPRPPALEVLVGPTYPHLDRLLKRAAAGHTRVHRDIDGAAVADLMEKCDLAVASAGMVACELAALGVPSILVVTSEDQRGNAAALLEAGAAVVVDLGPVAVLLEEARRLAGDREGRRALSLAGRQLVDGGGACRVVDAMLEKS